MTKRVLVILNILLVIALITLAVKDEYPLRLKGKYEDIKSNAPFYLKNRDYRTQMDLYKHYQGKGRIVMLGNSITGGVEWNELLGRHDVINRGIANDVTAGFLARMEYTVNVEPELCFIMGGVNDLSKGIPPEAIVSNLSQMVTVLREHHVKPFIASILHVTAPYPDFIRFNRSVKQTNTLIQKMCADLDVGFVDLNSSLAPDRRLLDAYSSDGIHLTGAGYAKWREILLPIIERELNGSSSVVPDT